MIRKTQRFCKLFSVTPLRIYRDLRRVLIESRCGERPSGLNMIEYLRIIATERSVPYVSLSETNKLENGHFMVRI